MVLDEPTAALDPLAEQEVYTKFDNISTGKTTVYISHRLSSCKFCDEILVLHNGELVQQGNHNTLVNQRDESIMNYGTPKQATIRRETEMQATIGLRLAAGIA